MAAGPKSIEGNVVRIISSTKLIINLGLNDGINIGDTVTVYGQSDPILDYQTNVPLGLFEYTKANLQIIDVFDDFSLVGSPKQAETINVFGNPFDTQEKTVLGPTINNRSVELEELPIDKLEISEIDITDSIIHVGDLVKVR